jgi:hypothetical protein
MRNGDTHQPAMTQTRHWRPVRPSPNMTTHAAKRRPAKNRRNGTSSHQRVRPMSGGVRTAYDLVGQGA